MSDKRELIKLCIDTAKNRVQRYSKEEANEVIREAFINILGTDKPTWREYRRHEIEVFEILEEVLDQLIVEGWGNNPFFNRFVETRYIDIGDANEFYVEDRTMLKVSKVAGNHWDLRKQILDIGDTFTIPTFWYGARIGTDFERVLAGRLDWGTFIEKVAEAFDYEIKSIIYSTFMDTQNYLPPEFKESGSFSVDKLRNIVEHVEATSGAPAIIAGTRSALANIIGNIQSSWVSDGMRDQFNNTGIIPNWEGVELFLIPQVHARNSFEFKIDNNRLMILPNRDVKPVKLINEGEARIKNISNETTNMDMSYEYVFQKKFGVGVIFNILYGMYDIEK